jgi:hypothetical protein
VIDWFSFLEVLVAAWLGASVVVGLYALGLRLLAVSGNVPFVPPVEFDEAITVLTPKQVKKEAKRARKASERNPYSPGVKLLARIGAYVLFGLAAVVVLYGIYLIVPYFHS